MKMIAFIKEKYKMRVVTDDDIRDTVNALINMNIQDYLDTLDDNEKITIDSLAYLHYSECTLSNYTADRVLKRLIDMKRKYEIKKILSSALKPYDIDEKIISYLLSYSTIYSSFYTDPRGKVRVSDYRLKSLFESVFYSDGERMLKALVDTVNSSEFSLEYYCHELREYFSVKDFNVQIDSKNFETFLMEIGEISNPQLYESRKHKCYDCTDLSPLTCEKAEYIKKPISEYPFIESGYQIFSENRPGKWEMETFFVGQCQNYSYTRNTPDKGSKSKKRSE